MTQISPKTIYTSKKGESFQVLYDVEAGQYYAQMIESPYLCTPNRDDSERAYADGYRDRFLSWREFRLSQHFG